MGLMNFYKPRKPSKFRYTYRYYDAKKEEMQKRISRARRKYYPEEFGDKEEAELVKDKLRGAFHQQSDVLGSYKRGEDLRGALQQKNWTILLILILLLVLFLWLYDNIGIHFFSFFGF